MPTASAKAPSQPWEAEDGEGTPKDTPNSPAVPNLRLNLTGMQTLGMFTGDPGGDGGLLRGAAMCMGLADEGSPIPTLPPSPTPRGRAFLLKIWLFACGLPRSVGSSGADGTTWGGRGPLTHVTLLFQTANRSSPPAHTLPFFQILSVPGTSPPAKKQS